ncbi:MAG: radical SAM protein [Candidatus Altiarchaeales archaeon]|nr:MAG: radical SAM protein [Candidatus Altiarchaeales archaeon]
MINRVLSKPRKIRVSIGTATVLGVEFVKLECAPRTAYLQTYYNGRCMANCRFCAQARNSNAKIDRIARGLYLPYNTDLVVERLNKAMDNGIFKRICIQTIIYDGMLNDLFWLVGNLDGKISVSLPPQRREILEELKDEGVDKIVIPLDGVTEEIFDEIKGKKAGSPYRWEKHWSGLKKAVEVFGKGNVGTHLIVGLGETQEEFAIIIQKLHDLGIYSALFAYTPIPETNLNKEAPTLGFYRKIQLIHYLISEDISNYNRMEFEDGGIAEFGIEREFLEEIINSGEPFTTKGCPDCNRPFATERVNLPYNFPRKPDKNELKKIMNELNE